MSNVTEVEEMDAFIPENLQSNNQNSGMNILQMNPIDLPSLLQLPEELMQESENSDHVVQLTTFGIHSNADKNDCENDNCHQICTMYTNYQECESNQSFTGNQSFTVDLNVQTIKNSSVNEESQILDQNAPEFEKYEVNLDPVMETSEEQYLYEYLLKQKSLQELNQQDGNKSLALIPNQCDPQISQTDKSDYSSEEQWVNEQFFKQKSLQELNQQDGNNSLALIPNQCDPQISQTDKSNYSSEEQWVNEQFFKLKSWQELKQPDVNKNLALIPNQSDNQISQTDKSFKPSSTISTSTEIIPSNQLSAPVNMDAPMLTYLVVKITGSESKVEESLIFLDCIKRIEKWFAKLNELNLYNTVRFQALLEKMIDFQRLESLVKEKQEMITIGREISLSDFQLQEGSNFDMSTYRTLYFQCERVLHLLKFYGRYLNSAFVRHRNLRTKYLECSIQIAMYPIEEKLFENRKKTMNILNQCSTLMNKISSKLEETDNFTDNLSFECISIVNNFFRDCEVMFS